MEELIRQITQFGNDLQSFSDLFKNHTHDGLNSKKIKQTVFITAYLPSTLPATAANYGIFFVATRPCIVKAISEVHSTLGSSTPTLNVEKLNATDALDSGDTLLATTFDLHAAANTPQRGILVKGALKGRLSLALGDRLALKDIGTLTAIAGLCVTVELEFEK